MQHTLVVVRNRLEYEAICQCKAVSDGRMVLWAPDFRQAEVRDGEAFSFLDDDVNPADALAATGEIHRLLDSWFLDREGRDWTAADGCSMGLAFYGSVEILLYSLSRFYLGLKSLAAKSQTVFVGASDPLLVLAARQVESELPGSICLVAAFESETGMVHPLLGVRAVGNTLNGSWLDGLIARLFLLAPRTRNDTVFVLDAGKLVEYLDFHAREAGVGYRYIEGARRRWPVGRRYFWKWFPTGRGDRELAGRLASAFASVMGKAEPEGVLPGAMAYEAIRQVTTPHWASAMAYYRYYRHLLRSHRPRLVLLGTDGWENHLLCLQAARAEGIPVALLPHGLMAWGASLLNRDPRARFDYYLSTSRNDRLCHEANGVEPERIYDAVLPWFSGFAGLPERASGSGRRRAIILTHDLNQFTLLEPVRRVYLYLRDLIEVCEAEGIDIGIIKFRTPAIMQAWGLHEGENKLFGRSLRVVSGYGELKKYMERADLVIGPLGSATIECSLAGLEYYTYHAFSSYAHNPNIYAEIGEMVQIAETPEQLRKNLEQRHIFRDGYSVRDLVNIAPDFRSACRELDGVMQEILASCNDARTGHGRDAAHAR